MIGPVVGQRVGSGAEDSRGENVLGAALLLWSWD